MQVAVWLDSLAPGAGTDAVTDAVAADRQLASGQGCVEMVLRDMV